MGRWHQSVDVKNYEFKYLPEEYQRPIALVVCRITFSRQYLDEYGGQFAEEWVGNWDVIVQVEPGPYDVSTNKWRVIDYVPHEPESSVPKWTLQ